MLLFKYKLFVFTTLKFGIIYVQKDGKSGSPVINVGFGNKKEGNEAKNTKGSQ